MDSKTTMYIIYASDDTKILQGILQPMRSLEDDQKVKITLGEPIHSGKPWKPAQAALFNDTDIYVLLLSNAFMYSEFVQQLEFKKVIDRYKAEDAKVIPILLNQCPWDTNFEADEYTFSFSELKVLPENKNPISSWDSPDTAYQQIQEYLTSILPSNQYVDDKESLEVPDSITEDQLAISFAEEERKSVQKTKEKVLEEQERAKEELARQKAETEKKAQQEKDLAQERAEKQKRLNAIEAEQRAKAERKRRQAEEEEKRIANEEKVKKEARAKIKLEEDNKRKEEAKLRAAAMHEEKMAAQPREINEERPTSESRSKKQILIAAAIVALLLIGFWAFWPSENTTEDSKAVDTETDTSVEVKDEVTEPETKTVTDEVQEPVSELAIGDVYEGGFIFEIDASGTTGKIAHLEDVGPMPWKDAMQIQVQLGDEWRVPTIDELKVMYKTIGQGATNSGEFADELYWSATSYDEYQARLLRFRDGNTSYHYNKEVESRKFRVRAIQNFNR